MGSVLTSRPDMYFSSTCNLANNTRTQKYPDASVYRRRRPGHGQSRNEDDAVVPLE